MSHIQPPHPDARVRAVLLVGFETAAATAISAVLEEVGHRAIVAREREAAGAVLRGESVDLAMADLEGRFVEVMGAIEALREAGCPLLGVGSLESAAAMTDGLRVLGLEGIVPSDAPPQELVFRVNAVLFADRVDTARPNRRVPTDLPATFEGPEGAVEGRVLNLSETGLFLAAERLLPVNRTVNVRVTLEDATEPLTVTCRVVWTNAGNEPRRYFQGMGLQILQLRPKARAALERFLLRRRAGLDEG